MFADILKDVRDILPDLKSDQKKIRLATWDKVKNRCLEEYSKDVLRFHSREKAIQEYTDNIKKLTNAFYPASRNADKDQTLIP